MVQMRVPLICRGRDCEVGAGLGSGSENSEAERQQRGSEDIGSGLCRCVAHAIPVRFAKQELLSWAPFFFSLFSSFLVILMTDHELLSMPSVHGCDVGK
jgi:hypothetical protein